MFGVPKNKNQARRTELVNRFRRTIKRLLKLEHFGKSIGIVINFQEFTFEDLYDAERALHNPEF